jgi:hypothetical protein
MVPPSSELSDWGGDVTGMCRRITRKVASHSHLSGLRDMDWFGPIGDLERKNIAFHYINHLWRLRKHITPKRRYSSTRVHRVTTQKATLRHIYITYGNSIFRRVCKITKMTVSFVMCVCSHGTTRLPLDGFSWNLIFKYFLRICLESSIFIEIWQEKWVLYMKTYVHLYLAELFIECEMFQTTCRENQNIQFMFNNLFFSSKIVPLWDNVEKCGTARQVKDESKIRPMPIACWITKATDVHSEYLILIAISRLQWSRERASMLRLYINCQSCWFCNWEDAGYCIE